LIELLAPPGVGTIKTFFESFFDKSLFECEQAIALITEK
jgi:hypothetical protein